MVLVANLEMTGRKVITAEIGGGIIVYLADGRSVELSFDETNLLLDFLIQKREMEAENV